MTDCVFEKQRQISDRTAENVKVEDIVDEGSPGLALHKLGTQPIATQHLVILQGHMKTSFIPASRTRLYHCPKRWCCFLR